MENEKLSLEQKMVQIRAEIPALVKRTYSEDVSYDFVKIDDIFQHLAPAMNKWKVNFDIMAEKASKVDEQGNAIFIMYLNQCQMWLYEADLDIKWVNAENPEEAITVTIHAIGTHEMPEKAKGSAWTYALKYYLLDKYCIDQGGEDPDMRSEYPAEDSDQEDEASADGGEYYDEETADYGEPDMEDMRETGYAGNQKKENEETVSEPETVPASKNIRPESGRMVHLPESARKAQESQNIQADKETGNSQKKQNVQTGQKPADVPRSQPPVSQNVHGEGDMTVEEACDIICGCGLHRGERLGDLVQKGEDGYQALRWFANEYRGKDERLKAGARLLVQSAQAA